MKIGLGLSLTGMQRRRDTLASVIAAIFRDSDGFTTPLTLDQYFKDLAGDEVSENTDPIALALSKDKGLVLGPELAGDISGFTALVGGGALNPPLEFSSTGTGGVSMRAFLTVGNVYQLDLAYTKGTAATEFSVNNSAGSRIDTLGFSTAASNSFTAKFLAVDTNLYLRLSGTDTVTINNISVRELPGNHATQPSTTFRPTLNAGDVLFDGGDDRLVSPYVSGTSGSLFARFNGATASRVLLGAQPATDGRAFLALDASGRISAGIGEQSTGVIFAGPDLRDIWHTAGVTWDGTTVKLYLDGAEVYSEPQVGAVSGTTPAMIGALNANGTAAAFWDGRVSNALAVDRPLTPTEITKLTNKWSA